MKAMIIADNEEVIERVRSVVKAAGYDTVVYRWLLKAIDNMEEVSPHLIVVSTREYPRHWKTLAQFATMDFGGFRPQVILFTGGELSDEELKKAEALHVRGVFSSITVEGLDELREILAREDDIFAGNADEITVSDLPAEKVSADPVQDVPAEPEMLAEDVPTVDAIVEEAVVDVAEIEPDSTPAPAPAQTVPCTLVFTNPLNGALVTGISRNYDGNTVEFEPDFDTPQLEEGTEISSVSLRTGETITAFKACVLSASSPFILKLA